MALPANIRVNLTAPFPAQVTGQGGVTIGKQNGIWTVGYGAGSYGTLPQPTAAQMQNAVFPVWNTVTQSFVNVPLTSIGTPILLNTLTANNSANLQDTTSFAFGYNDHSIVFENVVPVTNNVAFKMLVQSGGTFQITGYANANGSVATTYGDLLGSNTNLGNTAGVGFSGEIKMYGIPSATTTNKQFTGFVTWNNNAGTAVSSILGGWWNGGQGALTGLQFLMGSGNISTGTIKIYGWL